jgi:transposase InsO family protein
VGDRDAKFTSSFDSLFDSIGIEAIKTPVRSPRANAYPERWVRTVREDCLDHLLIFNRRHLDTVLTDYLRHYNQARPHRGLDLDPPEPTATSHRTTTILRRDTLGGLIHEYEFAA